MDRLLPVASAASWDDSRGKHRRDEEGKEGKRGRPRNDDGEGTNWSLEGEGVGFEVVVVAMSAPTCNAHHSPGLFHRSY